MHVLCVCVCVCVCVCARGDVSVGMCVLPSWLLTMQCNGFARYQKPVNHRLIIEYVDRGKRNYLQIVVRACGHALVCVCVCMCGCVCVCAAAGA